MTQYWGTGRLGAAQKVAYTGTAGTIGTAIGGSTLRVRVVCTTAAYIKIDKNPTATTDDTYVPADCPEYFSAVPGMKVSAIQVSSAGTLFVTEVS